MIVNRRQVLASGVALASASAVAASSINELEAHAARQRLVIADFFKRLSRPPSQWKLDDLLSDVVTFLDLNNASFGQVNGKQKTIQRLKLLHETGDLKVEDRPMDWNVMVTPQWAVFATTRGPLSSEGLFALATRPIAFGFQFWKLPEISILTVMRPFEPSFAAASECDLMGG